VAKRPLINPFLHYSPYLFAAASCRHGRLGNEKVVEVFRPLIGQPFPNLTVGTQNVEGSELALEQSIRNQKLSHTESQGSLSVKGAIDVKGD
jgi:hypothetical protein